MSKEIKKQIDKLFLEMEDFSIPDSFILNPKMFIIAQKIDKLQKECKHNFVDGKCEFCYLEDIQ